MRHKAAEYDYEASSYDISRFNSGLGKHLDYLHKRIVGHLLNSNGKTVLDAGVGTGRFAVWLTRKGFEVVGVDVSKEMLKKAKEKAQTLPRKIHIVLGDVNFLPFREGVFDNYICINVVNHIPEIDGFLKEVKYVIKQKGIFIVNFPNLQSLYFPIAVIINLRKRVLFKGGKIRSKWFTPIEIKSLMRNAGFNIKEVEACAIASPIPFGDELVKIIERVNLLLIDSKLKLIGGSLFVRAEKVDLP
jgi:2-polyprenyl-3-methyl-5-hydroxy-6-metoxy-1,4-benzoquinol methylase